MLDNLTQYLPITNMILSGMVAIHFICELFHYVTEFASICKSSRDLKEIKTRLSAIEEQLNITKLTDTNDEIIHTNDRN